MDFTLIFYALKPVLMTLIQPPLPFLALMLIGAGLIRARRTLGLAVLLSGFFATYLSCTEGMGQLLATHWIETPPALEAAHIQTLKKESIQEQKLAVLVLGGGIRQWVPEFEGPRLSSISQERLLYGAWLSKQLNAPLGYSGGIGWTSKRQIFTEAEVATRHTQDDLKLALRWAEGQSRDTRENAALSVPLLKKDGITTLVLVTHDLHMPRALQAFKREAGDTMRIVAAPVGLRRDAMSEWQSWRPSASGLARVNYAVYEWIARLGGH